MTLVQQPQQGGISESLVADVESEADQGIELILVEWNLDQPVYNRGGVKGVLPAEGQDLGFGQAMSVCDRNPVDPDLPGRPLRPSKQMSNSDRGFATRVEINHAVPTFD
jgi:hypothetical protein